MEGFLLKMEGLPDDFPENNYLLEIEMTFKDKTILGIKAFIDVTSTCGTTVEILKNGENGRFKSINLLVIRGMMYGKGCV